MCPLCFVFYISILIRKCVSFLLLSILFLGLNKSKGTQLLASLWKRLVVEAAVYHRKIYAVGLSTC